ncbi:MAG: DEAD/DEAH box helicase family protein [Comamonas sp.]|jgi:type III restriction enzyme|nr:DEAD/DEAH box helicase family protein [Comamonas sp.]
MSKSDEIQTFKNEEMVLAVQNHVSGKWQEDKYDAFLDALCDGREYQIAAIKTALRYQLGGRYENLLALAKENHERNDALQRRWSKFSSMEKQLQLSEKLSCSIDLATGTGKSYVLYGIAAILLAEGAVDRVLVLCPSNTIEAGLMEKFSELAGNDDLRDVLPVGSSCRTPSIINASQTIVKGSICTENYHAILEATRSSIRDSLKGGGEKVAVLNDEAHHVFNDDKAEVKRWKEFLLSPDYGFRHIVNVSGTCYVGDEYFPDVVYRYSLRQAIEEGYVKQVDYVSDMPPTETPEERWQIVWQRHEKWKKSLKAKGIRPLTIVVTPGIPKCEAVEQELVEWLAKWEGRDAKSDVERDKFRKEAENKVLAVTSSTKHKANLAALKTVDLPSSKIEWIISVSMLSEGWDVKNVFQIYPHEEKAFNSKLLIAQVLGRGLRRPMGWEGPPPAVSVFNHESWSTSIKALVNEILEIERRLGTCVLPDSPFHFELSHIDYTRDVSKVTSKKASSTPFPKGYVDLPSQTETEDVSVRYERAVTKGAPMLSSLEAKIVHETFSDEDVARTIYKRLKGFDTESQATGDPEQVTDYAKQFPYEKCLEIVRKSLERSGIKSGRVTDDNRQRFFGALGHLGKKVESTVVYSLAPKDLTTILTKDRGMDSCSAFELRKDKSIFYTPDTTEHIHEEQMDLFKEVCDVDGAFKGTANIVHNAALFKTPMSLVIADSGPERRFIRELVSSENTAVVDAWVKSKASGFYSIEYLLSGKQRMKSRSFNPDFFIKVGDDIFVIETKGDEEIAQPADENVAKRKYAVQHFDLLNTRLKASGSKSVYHFNMLTPKNFKTFFQMLRDGNAGSFRSELDVTLQKATEEDSS